MTAQQDCAAQPEGATQQGPPGCAPLFSSFHVSFCEAKGEDVSIVCKSINPSSGVAMYAVADGHNGGQAAKLVGNSLAGEFARQLGGALEPGPEAVRKALARTFVAANDMVCHQLMQSGCTLTAAVVSGGDTLTIANVGDSAAILDTGAEVIELTEEHRIGRAPAELARLEAAGGRLARLNEYGAGPSCGVHDGVGPVRLWPGGIMVGRAVGDKDVGSILVANPHLRQLKLPPTGARLIIASDGLWDAMPAGRVARMLRSQASAKGAAMQAVSGVAASLGGLLRDDVTVIVVDFLPQGCRDFRQVCHQFQGRLRSVLSNPQLSSLVATEPEEDEKAQQQQQQQQQQAAPSAPRRGLFACFSKPVVFDPECHPNNASASGRNFSARSTGGGYAGGSAAGNPSARSGHGNRSVSLGGSERSVRSGVARDPSVRGWRRATSVELIFEGDTAGWGAADFGRAPSLPGLGCHTTCSRSSSSSVQRSSPRSLTDGVFGHSIASFSSEDSLELPYSPGLMPSMSLPVVPEAPRRNPLLLRKNSAPSAGEKKCHGSMAAAALLLHTCSGTQ